MRGSGAEEGEGGALSAASCHARKQGAQEERRPGGELQDLPRVLPCPQLGATPRDPRPRTGGARENPLAQGVHSEKCSIYLYSGFM